MTDSPSGSPAGSHAGPPADPPADPPAGPPAGPPASADRPDPAAPASGPQPPPGAIVSDPPAGRPTPAEPPAPTGTLIAPPPPTPPAPTETPAPAEPTRPGLVGLLAAAGVGLLGAAIALSTMRSRDDGDLDWSNYSVGLGATAVLLLVALVAAAVGRGRGRGGQDLATWPGAIGILGAASMIGVGLEEQDSAEDWLPYLIGGVVVLLSVIGYVAVRRGAFVVTAILGLVVLYAEAFDDLVADQISEGDEAIWYAAAVAVFVVAVTALGWVLPTRALSGVVVGVGAIVAYAVILGSLAVAQFIGGMFDGLMADRDGTMMNGVTDSGPGWMASAPGDFDNDVWTILVLAGVLTLLWAVAAAVTGNSGFSIAAIAMPSVTVPLATIVLAVEHPTWWGVVLAGAGALLLLVGGLRLLAARRKANGYTI